MQAIRIEPIPAFSDNYIWAIISENRCTVVDPGDAKPVLDFCSENQLILAAILVTHHHWDHTNGIEELVSRHPEIPVYGPNNPTIAHLTETLNEGDSIHLAHHDLTLNVLEVPGHTLDHIAYVTEIGLFCGDTLFSGGCGKLFEGTPAQMNHSLGKLMQLPDDLPVYCTHEYTLANLEFALAVEPQNQALRDYQAWSVQQRQAEKPTLPSKIGLEKGINPFLRTQELQVKTNMEQQVGRKLPDSNATFAAIRGWKDNF